MIAMAPGRHGQYVYHWRHRAKTKNRGSSWVFKLTSGPPVVGGLSHNIYIPPFRVSIPTMTLFSHVSPSFFSYSLRFGAFVLSTRFSIVFSNPSCFDDVLDSSPPPSIVRVALLCLDKEPNKKGECCHFWSSLSCCLCLTVAMDYCGITLWRG